MLGIVFCGGKSSRMGRDKGLIPFRDKTWASIAAEKLHALDIPVYVSINRRQKPAYKHLFNEELLLVDDESLGIGGPMLGLLSAHLYHPDEDLFVLACDLPLMRLNLLNKLIDATHDAQDYEAFVFSNAGAAEPLCAIYKASGLRKVINELQANRLSSYSMKSLLSLVKVLELQIEEGEHDAFENFNSYGLT